MDTIKVALAQYAPVYLNLPESLDKAISVMEEAAGKDCHLLVFGETWLSGYPFWLDYVPTAALWDNTPTKEVFAKMHQSAVTVPGAAINRLQDKAKELSLTICMGINEKVTRAAGHGTLFNSMVIVDSMGNLVHHHRKLMPTFAEKLVYGLGDSRGLRTVNVEGWSVGGLICWEHWMPLSRQAMHNQAEQIHLALWPHIHELHEIASRHYAFEGRCYVLAVGLIGKVHQIPEMFDITEDMFESPEDLLLNGGSCIIGPDGKYLVAPTYDNECLITATLNQSRIKEEQMTLDVTGHYSRPDIYEFRVKDER